MNFLNNEFENQQFKDVLEELVDKIIGYDVYDFISRVSGLNLMSENQNKSVLLDSLVQYILKRSISDYKSQSTISSGKFKKIIEELNGTFLSSSIDPCENTFIQNVMFGDGNYKVFNGIDLTPAYNLQVLIRVLFAYQNDYSEEFLKKAYRFLSFILGLSEEIASKLGIDMENIKYDEQQMVILPSSADIKKYANLINIPLDRVKRYINGYFDLKDMVTEFGIGETGNMDERPFYSRPFLVNEEENSLIILNIALLPTYAFYKIVEWAEDYEIKESIINRYNDYLWMEIKRTLDELEHKKIDEKALGLQCVVNEYYKEMIATVYNNQLMAVFFICDDANLYPGNGLHSYYPDDKHNELFNKRLWYFEENIRRLEISKEDWYVLVIISGFGRGIGVAAEKLPFGYKAINLNPFELHCIGIKERRTKAFFPRYIRAKNQINSWDLGMVSELNAVSIYTSNNYSFYISDDFNLDDINLYIAPGDSIDYISEALIDENRILIDSYADGEKTEIICSDKLRNIYVEDELFRKKNMAFCIRFENITIWIKTNEIEKYEQLNLYFTIMDVISYWLAECKDILENMDFPYKVYVFHVALKGNIIEYYREQVNTTPFDTCIDKNICKNHVILCWKPEAFGNMAQKTNVQEKELCKFLLNIFNELSYDNRDYKDLLDVIFENPLKKKFFSFDYNNKPYLKPVEMGNNRRVHKEDEDYILGLVGKELLKSGRWQIGVVPDIDRNKVSLEVVSWLYKRLEVMVAEFSSENMIETIYFDLEDTLYNLILSERRFYSDIVCYPENEDRYIEEYNNLNQTSLALKFLIEYVTARPSTGTKHFGIGQYEELIAICAMIIDWAYKGDLFEYKIINTPIEFLKSKRIGLKKDEFIDMYRYGDIYRRRQLKYNSSKVVRKQYEYEKKDFSDELEVAFEQEFGYRYSLFAQVIFTMVDYNKKEIAIVEEQKLASILSELNTSLSESIVNKVIDDITYRPREDYLKLPSKYNNWEVYPWRFNRRYSFNRRPVLQRGNYLIWGNRQLYHMLEYVTELIYSGKLKAESTELRELMGKINDERGASFNKLILEIIKDMNVFKVYPNVKKINSKRISGETGNDLGDIDILLIDDKTNLIIAVEVKDFHFSRNPYEIQQEYIKMFEDKKNETCFATKHLRRVNWIKDHLDDVRKEYSLDDRDWIIDGIFIVSEPLISSNIYKQNIKCISKAELCVEAIRDLR